MDLISGLKDQRSRSHSSEVSECLWLCLQCHRTLFTFTRWRDHMLLTRQRRRIKKITYLLAYLLTY